MPSVKQSQRLPRTAALLLLLVSMLGNSADGAVLDDAEYFPTTDRRHMKTLLHWNGAPPSNEPEDPDPRIITDRPHFAEAATTVGLGRVQIETGYTYFRDNNAGTRTQTHSAPETLFRIGMFREWFEFRLQYNYLVEHGTTGPQTTTLTGSDDIYVGAKVALTEQAGILPEFTVFPQMRVPTGHKNFTSQQVLPGMNFVYAWMLAPKLELEMNTQVNRRGEVELDHYYTEVFQTINFEYDVLPNVMLFNEFIMIWPNGALVEGCQYYEHTGIQFFLARNVQLDFHVGLGLNDYADDFFGGTGLSWRW